jgi:glycosyltransferase involved in cell wall biosynthesis
MNKRIHFVHFTSKPGGIEIKRPLLIKNMLQYVFSVFVIRPPVPGEKNVYENIPVIVSYGAQGSIAYWLLFRYSLKNRKDIFHVFNIGPLALLMLRLAGVNKLIYATHGTIYWKTGFQKSFRKMVWKLAMHNKYFITSNSEFSGNVFITKVLNEAKPLVLYNPIDTSRFIPDGNTRTGLKKIVYSGRLAKGKNLIRWIRVAESVHKKYPDIVFEIYGEGPLKKLIQAQIVGLNLENIILLKGFSDSPELIYQQTDLLIFLSEYESFGNVAVESILCETPVIVSAIPSMKEIFRNFPEFLVNLDDNLEQNILLKIEQLEFLRAMVKNAAEEFKVRFSLDQHIKKVEEVYESFTS